MKKTEKKKREPEMRSEYDFRSVKGVRGKYYRAYREGHEVRIRHADGSVEVRRYGPADGAVVIEPDVLRHFPDAKSVNDALRGLIGLVPTPTGKRRAGRPTRTGKTAPARR